MEFIKAEAADILTIQKLAEASWGNAYKTILSPEQIRYMLDIMYSTEEIKKQMDSGSYHYYLIKEDKAVGFIGFEHGYEADTTKLHRIYLLPEEKGKGFGKAGLSFVKSKAAEIGDKKVILNVNKQNPAQDFYRSQGFVVLKEEINDIGNGFVMDDYVMQATLDY